MADLLGNLIQEKFHINGLTINCWLIIVITVERSLIPQQQQGVTEMLKIEEIPEACRLLKEFEELAYVLVHAQTIADTNLNYSIKAAGAVRTHGRLRISTDTVIATIHERALAVRESLLGLNVEVREPVLPVILGATDAK